MCLGSIRSVGFVVVIVVVIVMWSLGNVRAVMCGIVECCIDYGVAVRPRPRGVVVVLLILRVVLGWMDFAYGRWEVNLPRVIIC